MKHSIILGLFCSMLHDATIYAHSVVFVHLGSKVPDYATIAVEQARLFNPTCPLFFIAPQHDVVRLQTVLAPYNVECIAAESLPKSRPHSIFSATTQLPPGYWQQTTERFFYLDELIKERKLHEVFHLENDVMLYVNLEKLLPVLRRYYKGIAMTFCRDTPAVPGFMYIPTPEHMNKVAQFMAEYASTGQNDGEVLSHMKNRQGPNSIDHLPAICPEYAQKYPHFNTNEARGPIPARFYQHTEEFQGIFDAGPLSQFLHGLSPLNGSIPSGYVSPFCVFDVRHLSFGWELDDVNRKVPYMVFEGKKYRILIFHVHSKKLELARS